MVSDRKKLESSLGVASIERRKHPRYASSATAELVEIGSGARIHGRISDLGRGGCYIDAMSPFGVGSEVKIRIVDENRTFLAQARVVFGAAGMGMGLMFTAIDPEQLLVLERWLAELSGGARPEPLVVKQEALSQKATADKAPNHEQNYVLSELIIALMRKNVLSDLEGKALLQKLLQ
ncbi:MAG TPA: PilZ domain-containing protein [Candidatus Acidoferrum sp.]|nr:PilZ domain-containing protein [Candidatus Acidoferrum sp.]